MKETQQSRTEQHIMFMLDSGVDNLDTIYTRCVEELDLPRPTVRRITKDFRTKLSEYQKVLNKTSEVLLITN